MKLLRMPIIQGQGDTVTHGAQGWLVNNQSGIVAVPDFVADFMIQDGRSGCVLVEDPPPLKDKKDGGVIRRCPCCHYAYRE